MDSKKTTKTSRQEWIQLGQKLARLSVFVACLGGYAYQAKQFLDLYWTYPTIVDIQQVSPTYLDVPSFTICNSIGYNYTAICDYMSPNVCLSIDSNDSSKNVCDRYKHHCNPKTAKLPEDFQAFSFEKFLDDVKYIPYDAHAKLSVKLEEYLNCTISFAGTVKDCDLKSVMGSFYSEMEMPQYCYTIYSLWGKPDKKRERIPKGAIMKLHFDLNNTRRLWNNSNNTNNGYPANNLPSSRPFVQMAVHSPYFLPSPYEDGHAYQVGKSYQLRLTMDDKHLLPHPYQTNCTDYLQEWRKNGGKGPIDRMSVLQKCKVEKFFKAVGCVPITVDYPHTYNICGKLVMNDNNTNIPPDDKCTELAEDFNQPCDYTSYITTKIQTGIITIIYVSLKFLGLHEEVRNTIPEYNCTAAKIWSNECSTIDIEILFDRFEITNLTYNAKFESLELISVLGGYGGMWLGISFVAVYDLVLEGLAVWSRRGKRKARVWPGREETMTSVARNTEDRKLKRKSYW